MRDEWSMTYCHTTEVEWRNRILRSRSTRNTLRRVDRLVRDGRYPNRSQAIEAVISPQLDRLERRQLIQECAKLDPAEERTLADEGSVADVSEWPEY